MSERNSQDIKEALLRDGFILLPAKGVSMQPMLRNGRDMIHIERTDGRHLRRLDVILFQRENGQFIMHRIVKVRSDDYWVVGDNCTYGEAVRDGQVLGILTRFLRDNKEIQVTAPLYRLYAHIWGDLWHLRILALRVCGYITRHRSKGNK